MPDETPPTICQISWGISRDAGPSPPDYLNDKPEDYQAWKHSFQSATRDPGLIHKEEMDFLIKWLGTDSEIQTKQIRCINPNNLEGFERIWDRLEEFYRILEVMEETLFNRLEGFPKLSRDLLRLSEYSDLLMEIR